MFSKNIVLPQNGNVSYENHEISDSSVRAGSPTELEHHGEEKHVPEALKTQGSNHSKIEEKRCKIKFRLLF